MPAVASRIGRHAPRRASPCRLRRVLPAVLLTVAAVAAVAVLEGILPLQFLSSSIAGSGTDASRTREGPIPLLARANGTESGLTSSAGDAGFKEGFYVATLQGVPGAAPQNAHRLDRFNEYFSEMCPGMHVRACPGVIDERPGYGIATTWTRCITAALEEDDVDVAYFFEDDVRFHEEGLKIAGIRSAIERHQKGFGAARPRTLSLCYLAGGIFDMVAGGTFRRINRA